ncbi:MAG: hypothetical protein IH851_10380 [Armatimonadetes bacterium]|nr:hypothetical protein [Armatimonadota bacterium]
MKRTHSITGALAFGLTLAAAGAIAQEAAAPQAWRVMAEASALAEAQKKNLFVMFGASW